MVRERPYPHFEASDFLATDVAEGMLKWFEQKAQWQLRKLDGYTGYADLSLQYENLPPPLDALSAPETLAQLRIAMGNLFSIEREGFVRVTAHRLLAGGSLKPHCDLAPIRFTHRLIIHLNRGWTRANGGLLCVFDGDPSRKKQANEKQFLPAHRSAFAFEISARSFHAVTPILAGERYTLSYTFYPPSGSNA